MVYGLQEVQLTRSERSPVKAVATIIIYPFVDMRGEARWPAQGRKEARTPGRQFFEELHAETILLQALGCLLRMLGRELPRGNVERVCQKTRLEVVEELPELIILAWVARTSAGRPWATFLAPLDRRTQCADGIIVLRLCRAPALPRIPELIVPQ